MTENMPGMMSSLDSDDIEVTSYDDAMETSADVGNYVETITVIDDIAKSTEVIFDVKSTEAAHYSTASVRNVLDVTGTSIANNVVTSNGVVYGIAASTEAIGQVPTSTDTSNNAMTSSIVINDVTASSIVINDVTATSAVVNNNQTSTQVILDIPTSTDIIHDVTARSETTSSVIVNGATSVTGVLSHIITCTEIFNDIATSTAIIDDDVTTSTTVMDDVTATDDEIDDPMPTPVSDFPPDLFTTLDDDSLVTESGVVESSQQTRTSVTDTSAVHIHLTSQSEMSAFSHTTPSILSSQISDSTSSQQASTTQQPFGGSTSTAAVLQPLLSGGISSTDVPDFDQTQRRSSVTRYIASTLSLLDMESIQTPATIGSFSVEELSPSVESPHLMYSSPFELTAELDDLADSSVVDFSAQGSIVDQAAMTTTSVYSLPNIDPSFSTELTDVLSEEEEETTVIITTATSDGQSTVLPSTSVVQDTTTVLRLQLSANPAFVLGEANSTRILEERIATAYAIALDLEAAAVTTVCAI